MICEFICPKCKGNLILKQNVLYCCNCKNQFQFRNNLYFFSPHDKYMGEIKTENLICLNKLLYQDNVTEYYKHFSEKDKHILDFLSDKQRCFGFNLLNINNSDIILDIGSGFGFIALNLAKNCKEIHALEWIVEKAEFAALLSNKFNINNFISVVCNVNFLPYADNSFNKIIMNGFLEWVPLSDESLNPKLTQINCLKKCHQLLKNKGQLYIGIENRYWFKYFLGHHDPHEKKLRYVTVIPRLFAKQISLFKRNKPYRTYIYSLKGYKKILKCAGFRNVSSYAAIPHYNFPKEIIKTDDFQYQFIKRVLKSTSRNALNILKYIVVKIGLSNIFIHSYIIIAEK